MTILDAKLMVQATDTINKVLLISGKHGVGKSDIVKQYATEQGLHNETMMISLMDESDLCGIPRMAEIGGQVSTIWAAPSWITTIINLAWDKQLYLEDLEFHDKDFEEYVRSNLNRL